MKKTVAMLTFNLFPPDSRIFKEAKTLITSKKFNVTIFAWKLASQSKYEVFEEIDIIRINTGAKGERKKIKHLFLFNLFLFIVLLRMPRFSVYQAHDFTTLPTAFLVARIKKSMIVYDSHEYYPALLISDGIIGRPFIDLVLRVEKFLSNKVDMLMTAETAKAMVFSRNYGVEEILVIFNAPAITQEKVHQLLDNKDNLRKKWRIDRSDFLIIYPGTINPGRCLEQLIEAISVVPLNNIIKVLLVGPSTFGHNFKRNLHKLIEARKLQERVIFIDPVPEEKIGELYSISDLVYAVYPKIRDYQVSIPTKILYAIRFQKMFITSNFGEMKLLADKFASGIAVNPDNQNEISQAIIEEITTSKNVINDNVEDYEELWWEKQGKKFYNRYCGLFLMKNNF